MVTLDVSVHGPPSEGKAEVEITRAMLRRIDPSAIVRGLYDFTDLADVTDAMEVRRWLQANRSGEIREAHSGVAQAIEPRPHRGRRPKFTEEELLHWTGRALELDDSRPESLRRALATEMSTSGRADLTHSTPENARDLLHTLRRRDLLQKPRVQGARERLVPTEKYLRLEREQ